LSASYLTVTCRMPAGAENELSSALERWPVLGCQVEDADADIAVTVFIDDVQANLDAAAAHGIRTVRFTTVQACRAALIALGCL